MASCFTALLNDFRPEIVHLNNIHSYLSPALASIAHALGIKVVWTLHDYKLLCPSYSRLAGGKSMRPPPLVTLQDMCTPHPLHEILGVASILAWIESLRWRRRMLSRDTDAFICPSAFMAHEMELGKYPVEKLYTQQLYPRHTGSPTGQRGKYYCYVGRLSEEKGVETLLEAATMLQHELRIAGSGPLYGKLKAKYDSWPQITFPGQLDSDGGKTARGSRVLGAPVGML